MKFNMRYNMTPKWTKWSLLGKRSFKILPIVMVISLGACTTNPATGDRQFTALLPAAKEAQVGAQEHVKIEKQFGKFMTGPVADYVSSVGQKVAKNTERKDVTYRFYTIDNPLVNAFALPGGYIYVTRGLLTLANSEAEMAAVIGHEIAHVTGRHAAERMSAGALTGIGAAVVGIATSSAEIGRAASLGSNLYISSYSRSQENEADDLGIRYLARAGYDPKAMTRFLSNLDAQSKLEAEETGRKPSFSFFSTHPMTSDRVATTTRIAAEYPNSDTINRNTFLNKINGLTYGDSASQGFARGNKFYHPEMGFVFTVPEESKIRNGQTEVAATHPNGTVILFDAARDSANPSAFDFLTQKVLKNQNAQNAERITVNGLDGATASFSGKVQGKSATIRVTVVEWTPGQFFRFQMAIPSGKTSAFMNELKKTTYSLRRLSASEKKSIRPKTLRVITAPSGATVSSMAAKMDVDGDKRKNFLVLNGLSSNAKIRAGQPYKIVVD
ncbi:MAG: M48 family metalloprotease [Pseudomonadota bacterium]